MCVCARVGYLLMYCQLINVRLVGIIKLSLINLQAELTHAKIIGDKEREREVRSSMLQTHMNTNVNKDPEDEAVLRRIWAAGSEATSTGRRRHERPFSVPVSMETANRQSLVSVN